MLNIQLNVDEVNYIINSLSKQPYEDVALLINNIREQAINGLKKFEESQVDNGEKPTSEPCCD